MIRFFDIILSLFGLVVLSPLFLIISLLIFILSGRPILYYKERVGINNSRFFVCKFRSMYNSSDFKSKITTGYNDPRITSIGYYLRKYKLDETPQLVNVLYGNMSFVGPRPEVSEYIDLYLNEYRAILNVKPGITDFASIEFSDENKLLANSNNPEQVYTQEIIPKKIQLSLKYIENRSLKLYYYIIFKTLFKLLMHNIIGYKYGWG